MSAPTTEQTSSDQITKCQSCGGTGLEEVLDLGYQPLCNEFSPKDEPARPETFYPLCLCHCPTCSLVQLNYVIATNRAFGEQYTYLTGSSNSLIEYFGSLASKLVDRFGLGHDDTVLDIGSNDGTFLKEFRALGLDVLGVEGSKQPRDLATKDNIPTLDRFFGEGIAADIKNSSLGGTEPRLITAMNVLAHTDNINEFLSEVVTLMGPESTFVSQSHWLISLVQQSEFDTIYHEHLRYYTLKSLTYLYAQHGLRVIDAEITDFYGGSILVYATKDSNREQGDLATVLDQESRTNVVQSLKTMKTELLNNKSSLLKLLVDIKKSGKRVIGIGAPMKASTLLNFYGVTPDLVEYIAEVNQLKIGTLVPGVRIPVIDENLVFHDPPDFGIILSWNMADRIISNYRSMGYSGKFILPVPEVRVIE